MRIKEGVRVYGIEGPLVLALVIADQLYWERAEELVVTSLMDGNHMRGSLHYVGLAGDLRLPGSGIQELRDELAIRLGPDYDVVVESEHIHVEFQPKRGY